MPGMSSDSFDFWLGTWDVSWETEPGVRQAGTNSVTRIDDTIRELFTDGNPDGAYIGASVSRWDPEANCWVQDYWDNRGYTAVFRGTREGDRMILDRVSGSDTGPVTRLVWAETTPASIRWDYERQLPDGGWESTWRIDYVRHAPGEPSAEG